MYLKSYQTLQAIPASANYLFKQYEKVSLFLGKPWFELFESFFLSPKQSQFIVIFNESRLPIVLLLLQRDKEVNKLSSTSNFYSVYFSPLISQKLSEKEIIEAYSLIINDYLYANKIYSLEVKPVLLTSLENKLLIQTLRKSHFIIDAYNYFGNWTLPLNGLTFQEYFNNRPSKLKNTIKRKAKKLAHTTNHHIQIYTTVDEIQQHFKEYQKIYKLSWKKEEPSSQFIYQFMLNYACSDTIQTLAGNTRLGIAYIDGKAVASQFWLVHNKSALIYKLAYDPKYKNFSIGSILTSRMMEYVIDIDKVKNLDYLSGDDPYKQDWMDKRQQFSSFVAYNTHTVFGFYYGLIYLIKFKIKMAIKYLLKFTTKAKS